MAGERGAINVSYLEVESRALVPNARPGHLIIWTDSLDSNSLYSRDEAGNDVQIVNQAQLTVGNSIYLWDWFPNNSGIDIPEFSAVRIIQGGVNDGSLALSDADEISEDSFLGLTIGGTILNGSTGKVIYNGKVPGAVAGLGLPSMTCIYMDNVPGQWTSIAPDFLTNAIFQIGFTRGDDLYLRPIMRSGL